MIRLRDSGLIPNSEIETQPALGTSENHPTPQSGAEATAVSRKAGLPRGLIRPCQREVPPYGRRRAIYRRFSPPTSEIGLKRKSDGQPAASGAKSAQK
jgi:hypothetical protein